MTDAYNSNPDNLEFSNRARRGEYLDDYEMAKAVNDAFEKEQAQKKQDNVAISLKKGVKQVKKLAATIIKATARAYPHLVKRDARIKERDLLRQVHKSNQPESQNGVTSFFLGTAPFVLFISVAFLLVSPIGAVVSVNLILASIGHALVICTGVLVLAAILSENTTQPKRAPNLNSSYHGLRRAFDNSINFIKRFPVWNVISVALSVFIAVFCVFSSQERLSISLLIGSIVLLSSLAICFGGKKGLSGIQYLYFLIRDAWLSLRIVSENLQLWLPSRLYRVEIALQEYINLANQYTGDDRNKLPLGPFTEATQRVLEVWYGYNPFPSTPPIHATPIIPVDRIELPNQPESTETEQNFNTPEPDQPEIDEFFSNPVDRSIRDDESEI